MVVVRGKGGSADQSLGRVSLVMHAVGPHGFLTIHEVLRRLVCREALTCSLQTRPAPVQDTTIAINCLT